MTGVPTTVDLENNTNQKKYTVNRPKGKSLVISRALCTLMAIGALLLAVLVGLVVFFLVPRGCSADSNNAVGSLVRKENVKLATSPEDEIDERLPRSIKPVQYMIQLKPDFHNSTTDGLEMITLVPSEDTDTIIFHVNKIHIREDSVTVKPTEKSEESLSISSQEHLEGERYEIVLDDQLKKGKSYVLTLQFQGELNSLLQARNFHPQTQDVHFRALMIHLQDLQICLHYQTCLLREAKCSKTPEMSTYLVAFIISELTQLQSTDDLIKIWARREFLTQTDYAGKVAPSILRYFENYFRADFPLKKIDIVAIPEFGFSAMENWGLLTFRESSLLFDNFSSTVEDKRTVATVLSHELAHQWFGNLVTPKWWNDLWLKEGFATYLQYLGVAHAEPSWNILDEFLPSEIERAMSLDALESSRPISFDVCNSMQIKQAFDEISYAKGACIIRMMNNFLGEETFKNGLIKYLQKFKYSNANRNDLFTSLTEEARLRNVLGAGESVKQIMDTWTEQAGFPVINVAPDYSRNTLKLVQKRFFLTQSDSKDKFLWWLPISFTSSVSPNFISTTPKFWMRGEEEIVEEVGPIGEWYLLNLNHTGYYIVNYDEHNWKQLIDHLMDFTPITWAQLISNAMDLARANQLDYEIPLKLIARMGIQDSAIMFVPTAVAFGKLQFLSDILHDTPVFGIFEVICANDIKKHLDGRILPNLRSVIYCTAIREGSDIEWDFAYKKYLETSSPTEKNVLLDALGCTKLKWLLSSWKGSETVSKPTSAQRPERLIVQSN
ncbi:hypothetical protein D910_07840, partial [Dendroctonus ponderosae]